MTAAHIVMVLSSKSAEHLTLGWMGKVFVVRSAPEHAREEAALVGFSLGDLCRSVLASAPLGRGNTPLHFLNVLAATRPRCFTAGSASCCSAHPVLSLSIEKYPRGYKEYTVRSIPDVKSDPVKVLCRASQCDEKSNDPGQRIVPSDVRIRWDNQRSRGLDDR
ncbi:MAG: hypothetical protein IT190_01310 [Microbacteriaceae bacterium]|nr:hypothetical protein [Microbacteriaceae bacterium]